MSKPSDSAPVYLAPGGSGYASMVFPGASQSDLPAVDDHVVEPETRQEMIDGRIVYASPAHPPHSDRHSQLDYVLRAVFLICVKTRRRGGKETTETGPVLEWSASEDPWLELAPDGVIEDPCLRCSVPVRALLDAAEADKAVPACAL